GAQVAFWAQGNHRLKSRSVAGDGARRVVLEDGGENHFGLQLREGHANAGARATAEWEVGTRWGARLVGRVPTLRAEDLRVAPDVGQAMDDPLAQDEHRSGWQEHTVDFDIFDGEMNL